MGAVREVAEAVGGGSDPIIKVLPCGGPGVVTLWGKNLGAVGSDGLKDQGVTRGIPTTGEGYEGAKARRRDL